MKEYVPGTEDEDGVGRTYIEVFADGVYGIWKIVFSVVMGLLLLALVSRIWNNHIDFGGFREVIFILVSVRVVIYYYIKGVKMGMHYQRTGNTACWD